MPDQDWLSLGALYRQYAPGMLYRAMQYVNNKEDAEDVVSEAWLSLLRHAHKLPDMDEKARSTYIMRCVQNTAIDHLRKSKKISESLQKASEETALQEHTPEESSDGLLSRLLSFLSARERQVVELKLNGFDDRTIARQMGIADSSVRVYLHRAHKQIRTEMQNIRSENEKG